MMRLFRRGEELINKEMDIVKILKSIRNLEVMLKSKILDKATLFQIKNSGKNVIFIDKESDEDSSSRSSSNSDSPNVEQSANSKRKPKKKKKPIKMAKIE